jgi:glycosyltransferase involved in cell wall biosynthesis
MKARVCMIHNYLVWRGGAELILLALCKELQRMGYEIDIYVLRYDRENCFPELTGDLRVTSASSVFKSRYFSALPCLQALELAKRISGKYDIIHAHNFPAHLAAFFVRKMNRKLSNTPYLWQCNEPPKILYDPLERSLYRAQAMLSGGWGKANALLGLRMMEASKIFESMAARNAAVILTLSQFVAHWVEALYDRSTMVVNPGLDLDRFNTHVDSSETERVRERIGGPLVLTVSRLWPGKNIETALRAFQQVSKRIPQARCVIVGDGPSRPLLVQTARQLGIDEKVTFVGDLAHDKLASYYAACDVFVFPALAEPWGLTPLEAMACGKPVVAAADGGPREFIKDWVDGVLVEPSNSDSYAEAVIQLLRNPTLSRSIGEAAAKKAQSYTWESMAIQVSQVYETLIMSSD